MSKSWNVFCLNKNLAKDRDKKHSENNQHRYIPDKNGFFH